MTALEHHDVGRFSATRREIGRRRELGVLAGQVCFADPTGLRAAASDEDRYAFVNTRANQLLQ